ncbi:MAG TPA: tryptophan--tRNA ligase [Acidimicrobiales bacterium]|nr:MAG: tryptophan--tRNA ligase [Actinobacteria bacterium 21-73-9]HQU25694.1 tryptophan--tRNA ligase [Acidimicrobiales bacterium]
MRIFSGMQPSGDLHLGNYLGALRQWVASQNPDAFYCVVDLHALTLPIEPATLARQRTELFATFLAAGLDPEVSTVFFQSDVAYHAQLNWLLECVVSFGELGRMTAFKEKAARAEGYRVGLFTYPVLMAGDILLYETEEVPVGDDQRQHLELCRDAAQRFNHRYGETFRVPRAVVPPVAARVMDLQEPTRKMSKSLSSPLGSIFLVDSPEAIARKVSRAVTDTDGEVRPDRERKPGLTNLLEIFASFEGSPVESVAERYTRYGDLKRDLSELVVSSLAPIRERYSELLAAPEHLAGLAARGAAAAAAVAGPVYQRAARAMGLG